MTTDTILRYLFFDWNAIEEIARNPWSVVIGFWFVILAGVARSYGRHNLLREPWRLLIPLMASTLTSILLFAVLFAIAAANGVIVERPLATYAAFLALYWMTAPLAWLYGLPIEWFLSRSKAIRVRLAMLALVAAWRVMLMINVAWEVLDTFDPFLPASAVILFADLVVLLVMAMLARPKRPVGSPQLLVSMSAMPGQPTARIDPILRRAAISVAAIAALTLPFCLLFVINDGPSVRSWDLPPISSFRDALRPTSAVRLLVITATVIGGLAVVGGTITYRRAALVESMVREQGVDVAIAWLARQPRWTFPFSWDPPPNCDFRDERGRILLDMVERALILPKHSWVRSAYTDQFTCFAREPLWYFFYEDDFLRAALIVDWLGSRDTARTALQALKELHNFLEMSVELPGFYSIQVQDRSTVDGGILVVDKPPADTCKRQQARRILQQVAGVAPETVAGSDILSME